MSLLKLGVVKQHKNSNSSFIRVNEICFTLRKINFKICFWKSSLLSILPFVWFQYELIHKKFPALATLLAGVRYGSFPSAQQQWKYRNHHRSQTLKSDEAKWPKMTKMTLTSSFFRGVPMIWTPRLPAWKPVRFRPSNDGNVKQTPE